MPMADSRSVTMLELDRHLSQSLEQARHAPMNVQRYGRSWVWVLSSDAWADAALAALARDCHEPAAVRCGRYARAATRRVAGGDARSEQRAAGVR
ncbi:hypothetical protein G6F23_014951 [Rhizopus arrhizus]|nr:hypothetical protein G6F23_014951 [Rhizopus arrhizus]